jgi:hypothetical protein
MTLDFPFWFALNLGTITSSQPTLALKQLENVWKNRRLDKYLPL